MSVNELQDLESTAVFVSRPLGIVEITGETRLDLIDRMSTNRVKHLTPGMGTATVLTSDIGRIIDRLLLYADEERLLVVTGPHHAEGIIRYLMRFVFFNDDFHMVDKTEELAVLGLYGQNVLSSLGLPPDLELALHHWQNVAVDGLTGTLHRTDPIGGASYFLIVPQEQSAAWQDHLRQAGVQAIDEDTYQRLRVQAGLPEFGAEMSLDFIPLETNLWDDVSFNKGCYIGQEIIARLESRGRLAKKLVQFHLPDPTGITAGSDILADGKSVGMLTSVAGEYALGYVKTAVLKEVPLLTTADAQEPLRIVQIYERHQEPETA